MDFLQSGSFDEMMAAMMMEPSSWCLSSPMLPAPGGGGPHSCKPVVAPALVVVPSQAIKNESEDEPDFHSEIEALLTSPPSLCSVAVTSTSTTTERFSAAASGPGGKSANNSEVSSLEELNSKKRRWSEVVIHAPPKNFFENESLDEQAAAPIMKKRARHAAASSSAEVSFLHQPPAAASTNAQTAASILESLFAASPVSMQFHAAAAAGMAGVPRPQLGNATAIPVPTIDDRAIDIHRILYYNSDLGHLASSRIPGGGSVQTRSQQPIVDRPTLIPAAAAMQQGGDATPASTTSCDAGTRPSNAGGAAAPASRLSGGRKGKIQARSMREKYRRHKILAGLSNLEDVIPSEFSQSKRMSYTKMDTCTLIQMASLYIKTLETRRQDLSTLCMNVVR